MNLQLMPIETLVSMVRDASSSYLFPMVIGCALVLLLLTVVMGRNGGTQQPQPQPQRAAPQRPAPVAVRQPAVLVVDDSAVARAKLRKLFEAAGLEVEVANDGLQALDALSRRFFSVLVTDLEMPNMSGIELITSVQGSLETEDLPIIAITGHDALQAHVRDYQSLYGIFKKPWSDRELLKRVQALATLREPARGAPASLARTAHGASAAARREVERLA